MSKTEAAITWMEDMAKDDSHGYDQTYRWGQRGDYDCSAAVITAWKTAGVDVSAATYTGNMKAVFLAAGFQDVTLQVDLNTAAGLIRGDVLLNEHNHVAMYCGSGREVEASINEFGGVTGGQPGDQTGSEFLIRGYRNYPWDCVLRYPEAAAERALYKMTLKQIKYGSNNNSVLFAKLMLKGDGYYTGTLTKKFTKKFEKAVRAFQKDKGLAVDGIVGPDTYRKLTGLAEWKKAAANGTCYLQLKSTKYGDVGEEHRESVMVCQRTIKALKYYAGPIGGNFKTNTRKGVTVYQKACAIPQTGEWDLATQKFAYGL